MHVFYLSNNSSRNNITNNTIRRAMGDPVRIRDSSSYNQITGNTFTQAGAESMFEEWFCDLKIDRRVCANHTAECPSWGNNVSDNLLDGNFVCRPLTVACLCQPREDYCGEIPRNGARVIARGNRQTAQPCSIGGSNGGGSVRFASRFAAAAPAVVCSRPGPGLDPTTAPGAPCNYTAGVTNGSSGGLLFVERGQVKCP
jgi:parallel beta-helix repeat protein